MILRAMTLCMMLVSAVSYAVEKCPDSSMKCDNTALGKLEYISGRSQNDKQSRILLNGKEIFKSDSNQVGSDLEGWILNSENLISKVIVFYDFNTPQYIKTDPEYGDMYRYRAYRLFDFSGKEVVISNEFYPPADYDASLDWVSWGKKNSVIGFHDGSRFRYESGRVTMIDDDTKASDNN